MTPGHRFEPADFQRGGQVVIRQNFAEGSRNFNTAEAFKIGSIRRGRQGRDQLLLLISLEHGHTTAYDDAEDLCERLNSDQFGFRPAAAEEIAGVVAHVGNRFTRGV